MASLTTKRKEKLTALVVAISVLLSLLALVSAAGDENPGKSTTLDSTKLREDLKAIGSVTDEQISAICDLLDSFDSSKQDDCGQAKFTEINDQVESTLYNLDPAKSDKIHTRLFSHIIILFKQCTPYLEDNIKKTVDNFDGGVRDDVCKINDYVSQDYHSKVGFFNMLPNLEPREKMILGTLAYIKDTIDPVNAEKVLNNSKMFATKYKDVVARPCSIVWRALKYALMITDHADYELELNDFSKKWIAISKDCRDLVAYMNSNIEKMYKHRKRDLKPRKPASTE